MSSTYGHILRIPGAAAFSIAGLLARFPMSMQGISTILADLDINIDSMVTIPQPSGAYQIIIRADITDIDAVKDRLWAKGFEVSHVTHLG